MKIYFLLFILLYSQYNIGQNLSRDLILKGIEAMYNNDYINSLELLIKAKTIAEETNNTGDQFLAINNIGANYYSMLDYGEALKNYLEAYDIAIKSLEDSQEMVVLNNIAILYSKEKQYKKAEIYFLKAYNLAIKNKDTNKLVIYSLNLAHVYIETDNPKLAEKHITEALQNIQNDPRLLVETKITLIQNLFLKREFSIAKKKALDLIPEIDTPEYSGLKVSLYLVLSKIFQEEQQYNEALNYTNVLLDDQINLESKLNILQQKAAIYLIQKKYLEAIETKDTIYKVQEELNNIKNGRLFESNRVKFEIKNYQKELLTSKEKIETQSRTFYILLFSSIIIIILFGWALRNSFLKNKQRKLLHIRNEEIFNLELEKEKTDNLLLEKQIKERETNLLLEKEKLKNEIETKNRKLSVKALYLSDRNKLIETIIEDLEKSRRLIQQPLLNLHIQKLKSLIKSESEWSNFLKHFEEVNQGFLSKLKTKHPDLNVNDIRFISYVYMNLSAKEISSILNITPEAARKRKERISKKLQLNESSQLYGYLSHQ